MLLTDGMMYILKDAEKMKRKAATGEITISVKRRNEFRFTLDAVCHKIEKYKSTEKRAQLERSENKNSKKNLVVRAKSLLLY